MNIKYHLFSSVIGKGILSVFLIFLFGSISLMGQERIQSKDIRSFGFQLQKLSLFTIRNASFDLVVIEPFLSSDRDNTYNKAQVALMKNSGHAQRKKIVLAYISIGEAENYRNYWKKEWDTNPPVWLGKENNAWPGNFKVRYWHPGWQKLILKNVDKILQAGFDGIYMDIIDAYYYWTIVSSYAQGKENRLADDPYGKQALAAERMLNWLHTIATHAREESPYARKNFLFFPQNGEDILLHLTPKSKNIYWKIIDGIGVEDLFYFGEAPENNPRKVDQYRLKILQQFPDKNKLVLSIDYLTKPELIKSFYQEARKYEFVPYATVRALDRLSAPAIK